jgi:hypothetical protein
MSDPDEPAPPVLLVIETAGEPVTYVIPGEDEDDARPPEIGG